MYRFACDSDQPGALVNTDFAFLYADLCTHDILADLHKRLPGTQVLGLDRGLGDPLEMATAIDVERFARRPEDCPGWYDDRRARGMTYLTVYARAQTMQRVDAFMDTRRFWRWFASWGAGLSVPADPFAMLQFASAGMIGAHLDLTVIRDDNWHPRTRI